MSFIRLLVVAAAFSSGEAFTPGVHAPAVRRVAAISPVVPTVMMVRASLLRSGPPVAFAHTLQCQPYTPSARAPMPASPTVGTASTMCVSRLSALGRHTRPTSSLATRPTARHSLGLPCPLPSRNSNPNAKMKP